MSVTLKELKTAHAKAVAVQVQTFEMDGLVFDVGYAKYLIQYFESYKVNPNQKINFKQERVE